MKKLRILAMAVFVAIITPAVGHSNHKTASFDKVIIEPSRLHFTNKGMFLKTQCDEWIPISQISHSAEGYYISAAELDSDFETSSDKEYDPVLFYCGSGLIKYGSRVSELPKKWKCPYCYHWWVMGEECKNEECPTNQWKKNKKEEQK